MVAASRTRRRLRRTTSSSSTASSGPSRCIGWPPGRWAALTAAARADGHAAPLLLPVSGYRTVEEQAWLWDGALAKYGDPDVACLWVARPGTSAHQSGRAIDLHLGDPIESEYAEGMRITAIYEWLVAHAARFGFYPYDIEPWHWEYNPPWPVSDGAGG